MTPQASLFYRKHGKSRLGDKLTSLGSLYIKLMIITGSYKEVWDAMILLTQKNQILKEMTKKIKIK